MRRISFVIVTLGLCALAFLILQFGSRPAPQLDGELTDNPFILKLFLPGPLGRRIFCPVRFVDTVKGKM